jgi:hypothetical protein
LQNFSASEYLQLYKQIEFDVHENLGYNIQLIEQSEEDIIPFFSSLRLSYAKPAFRFLVGSNSLDLRKPDDKRQLSFLIRNEIEGQGLEIVLHYLPANYTGIKDIENITDFLFQQFLIKDQNISQILTLNNKSIRENAYKYTQQYNYWSVALMETMDADFIITNTIIAGADKSMPLYVINRGGITSAITENNIHNRFQGAVVLALFPFINNSDVIQEERGEIPKEMLFSVISMMAVHEFGHLLLRAKEYYDHPESVLNAPKNLRYYDWYQKVSLEKRRIKNLQTLKKY